MNGDKEIFKYLKEFFDTLAGKLTAILAFALLFVIVLGSIGEAIPKDYKWLVYILAIGAMLIFALQAILQVAKKREKPTSEFPDPTPPPPQTGSSETVPPDVPVDPIDARERYLRSVIIDCSNMRLVGLDPSVSDPNRSGMSLEKLYISLDTRTPKEKPEEMEDKRGVQQLRSFQEKEPLSALEAWMDSDKHHMVLLGLPGTGKSTFVRYLALSMAKASVSPEAELPEGWKGRPQVPFMISLGRFAETISSDCRTGNAEMIEEYLVHSLEKDKNTKAFAALAMKTLEHEGALVMFDGLDEVADIHLRPLVVQAITDFVEKYSRNSSNFYLVTCRTFSYRNDAAWKLTGWETHELALLSRPKIEYFVNAWYAELGSIERVRKDEYERKRKELLETLQPGDRRRLIDIAAFPLILTIMAVVHTHFGSLPDTRAEVYERCVELLLIRWQGERSVEGKIRKQSILDALKVPPTVLYQALWEVAYKAHGDSQRNQRKGSEAALVTEDLLDGVLKVYLKERDKVETFLEYCQSANGLLMLQGTISKPGKPSRKVYTFPHLTFEEYLAARHLADIDPDEYIYDLVGKSDRWHEAIKLLGEHLCFGSPQRLAMSALLDALSNPDVTRNVEERSRMIWLAGDLLVLYQNAFPSKKAPSTERIFAQLKELAVTSLPDPRIRAECASLADELGYTPEDLHSFVQISPAFQIARYPVTNGQYARFLDAEDFHKERYWVDFPGFAEPEKKYEVLGNWGRKGCDWLRGNLDERSKLLPRHWSDPRFGASRRNAPVVGISWYEANAYCRWLAAHVEQPEWAQLKAAGVQPETVQLRLPTEAEWVLAAGGEEGDRFAWGKLDNPEEEIVRHANTDESGIGRTTPVWMYPQGESKPHKVLDMTGNVWEWQANFRDDDHDVLALRGGSWFNRHDLARVACRLSGNPRSGYSHLGFRVAVFPLPQ